MAEETPEYDLIVIGTGPGGYVAAIRAAQLGMRVATVEDDRPGGICLNWGCIPSKAILNSAELYATALHGETYGLVFEKLGYDYDRVITQSRQASDRLSKGVSFLFRKNKIEHYPGRGILESAHEVRVAPVGAAADARAPAAARAPALAAAGVARARQRVGERLLLRQSGKSRRGAPRRRQWRRRGQAPPREANPDRGGDHRGRFPGVD